MAIKTKALDLVQAHKISTEEGAYYYMMPQYLTKISAVENLDTKKVYKLDIECWSIYSYLSAYGFTHGYNSIYPNQDDIVFDLGIKLRTLQRKLVMLKESGFITVKTLHIGTKKDKNIYKVKTPKMIPRVRYLDVHGGVLTGFLYKFDPSIFHRNKLDKIKDDSRDIVFEMAKALKGDE